MRNQVEVNECIGYITRWISEIRLQNAIGYYDINKISENLSAIILNELYGYKLINANSEITNACAVDLIDRGNKVAVQVTSRVDGKKIKETLIDFVKNGIDHIYTNGIKFLILNFETVKKGNCKYENIYKNFNFSSDVITDRMLIKRIDEIYQTDYAHFLSLLKSLRHEFGFENVNVKDDMEILKEMYNCFDRPAFLTPFYQESNLPNFIKAIEGTIETLNTGVFRLRDGSIIKNISPKSKLEDKRTREVLSEIVDDLIKLRFLYEELIQKNEIKLCRCNDDNCGVHLISPFAIGEMDKARKGVLLKFKEVYNQFEMKIIY
ncbi:SMEK domain-containing protein [Paenibacillus sp. FSL E2-0202]|uniref:SMEK domain-containing protein n=1 Tax=Paenibacillus sp. FSL E2-0202 TaxID=2954505 RepID=UPI0030ED5C0B